MSRRGFSISRISTRTTRHARVFAAHMRRLAPTAALTVVVGLFTGTLLFGIPLLHSTVATSDLASLLSPTAVLDTQTESLKSRAEDYLSIREQQGKLLLGAGENDIESPETLKAALESHIADLDVIIENLRVEYALSCKQRND